eukprot:5527025-Karenia_brevis.AAC.1
MGSSSGFGQSSNKSPPAWDPEWEAWYPLTHFAQDLLTWTMSTDLDITKHAPCAIQQLSGAAQELAREMDLQELANGKTEQDPNTGQPTVITG